MFQLPYYAFLGVSPVLQPYSTWQITKRVLPVTLPVDGEPAFCGVISRRAFPGLPRQNYAYFRSSLGEYDKFGAFYECCSAAAVRQLIDQHQHAQQLQSMFTKNFGAFVPRLGLALLRPSDESISMLTKAYDTLTAPKSLI